MLVYRFAPGSADGNVGMRSQLGGKGANLAEMAALGLPVPPGFTISAELCAELATATRLPERLVPELEVGLASIERATELRFGDPARPLLLSVRSGAAVSMPGMMDTVLNLGMNDAIAEGLARRTGDARFAWDTHRRFVELFATVVLGLPREPFDDARHRATERGADRTGAALDANALRWLVEEQRTIAERLAKRPIPREPRAQLESAILAVFRSWDSDRAVRYREVQHLRGGWGTAVNVQAMVYGNLGPDSGTGVVFSRNPATGARELYGEYLEGAQGEDVVAGLRTPSPVATLAEAMPEVHRELARHVATLERHYRDVQDIEFTIERGKLYLLQTRHAKRTGAAAVRLATELVRDGIATRDEAILHLVEPEHLEQLLHPGFADCEAYRKEHRVIAQGLAASPGAAVGRLVFTAADARAWRARGERVVLAREETSPEDVGGMAAAEGVLTTRGGLTSHAAVVARGWGKPCVVGCGALTIDATARTLRSPERTLEEGAWVSINGTTGEIIVGREPLGEPAIGPEFHTLMGWVDSARKLRVRANADTPTDAVRARALGAEGIGLVRTEHMFFGEDRLPAMEAMIVADDAAGRARALATLLPLQRADFEGILRAMGGLPVTIRLFDPPLHEFVPHDAAAIASLAERLGLTVERVAARIAALRESNPMLGHRGCRLGITHPEITAMQARAIAEAACTIVQQGGAANVEILVPLVASVRELEDQRRAVERAAAEVFAERGIHVALRIGAMIEVPRAALLAGEIAQLAEFMSFGTNDLTQLVWGISRDDVASFLPTYLERGIVEFDPFRTLDAAGVGQLMARATQHARNARPTIELGVCGEHAGDPRSIAEFAELGLDYVSCSPYRVPLARLAAAQAALAKRGRVAPKLGEQ